MLIALAVALPFVLLTTGIVWKLADNERENRREAILYSTRALVSAVDALRLPPLDEEMQQKIEAALA